MLKNLFLPACALLMVTGDSLARFRYPDPLAMFFLAAVSTSPDVTNEQLKKGELSVTSETAIELAMRQSVEKASAITEDSLQFKLLGIQLFRPYYILGEETLPLKVCWCVVLEAYNLESGKRVGASQTIITTSGLAVTIYDTPEKLAKMRASEDVLPLPFLSHDGNNASWHIRSIERFKEAASIEGREPVTEILQSRFSDVGERGLNHAKLVARKLAEAYKAQPDWIAVKEIATIGYSAVTQQWIVEVYFEEDEDTKSEQHFWMMDFMPVILLPNEEFFPFPEDFEKIVINNSDVQVTPDEK